jgi:DNA-binding beta-propeller fold protein YncE
MRSIAHTGNGIKGSSPEGTPASEAMLNNPNGVATDSDGNVYIADAPTHTIKMVRSADGKMVVFAGRVAVRGYTGDGSQARAALLNTPRCVGVDGRDIVYICDR